MRIIVTGSRQFYDRSKVYRALSDELSRLPKGATLTVVHGNAAGADTLANEWCDDNRSMSRLEGAEPHPANWTEYGKSAGPIRNVEMVNLGADLVLAFYKTGAENRGTGHCVKTARRVGIEVREIWG